MTPCTLRLYEGEFPGWQCVIEGKVLNKKPLQEYTVTTASNPLHILNRGNVDTCLYMRHGKHESSMAHCFAGQSTESLFDVQKNLSPGGQTWFRVSNSQFGVFYHEPLESNKRKVKKPLRRTVNLLGFDLFTKFKR